MLQWHMKSKHCALESPITCNLFRQTIKEIFCQIKGDNAHSNEKFRSLYGNLRRAL